MSEFSERAKRARRMAERRIRGLVEASNKSSGRKQEYYQEQIEYYNYILEQTRMYAGGRRVKDRTVESRRAAVEELESLNERNLTYRERTISVKRSNIQFQEEIRMASIGLESDSGMDELKVRAFFKATQRAWERSDKEERYEAILAYYDVDNIEDVWNAVMKKNEKLLKILEKRQNGESLDEEELKFMQDIMSSEGVADTQYRKKDANSPLVGIIASNIPELEKDFS